MKPNFIHEDADVTPLTARQKDICLDMHGSFNAQHPLLHSNIYIQETLQGHVAIIKRSLDMPGRENRIHHPQLEVAARCNLRWLSVNNDHVSFGLPQ